MIKKAIRVIGVALSLCVFTACASIKSKTEIPIDDRSTLESIPPSKHSFNQSNSHKQSKPLWIWIAPQYRSDLPEGTGEYLIESI